MHKINQQFPAFYVGIMSGTSLDGVDVVLCSFDHGCSVVGHVQLPMPYSLRQDCLILQSKSTNEIHKMALTANRLAKLYASGTKKLLALCSTRPKNVRAIGCHGQTIRHQPNLANPYSLQINNPALLAEYTKIDVIADFRSRDIAAGGQGAPLVPAFHQSILQHSTKHRVILNIGGMANVTNLPAISTDRKLPTTGSTQPQQQSLMNSAKVIGFDCGPGCVLLDAWVQKHKAEGYDHDGKWAKGGNCNARLLADLLNNPFFDLPPPKSCGREQFSLSYLEQDHLQRQIHLLSTQDVQATLLEFTAQSVSIAITRYCPGVEEIYVCGGGAKNSFLLQRLAELLQNTQIFTTQKLGLTVDTVEAAAFAWLAWRFIQGKSGNLPEVTGASGQRILGALYPA